MHPDETAGRIRKARKLLGTWIVWLAALGSLATYLAVQLREGSDELRLAEAHRLLKTGEFEQALILARETAVGSAEWPRSRVIAAEAAVALGRFEQAVELLAEVPRDRSPLSVDAILQLSDLQQDLGRLSDAVEACEYLLTCQPESLDVHRRLAFLYSVTGCNWQVVPHLMALLEAGQLSLQELAWLGDTARLLEQQSFLEDCLRKSPADPLVEYALAAAFNAEGRPDDARLHLKRSLAANPSLVVAHALLGELSVNERAADFNRWHQNLPDHADSSPDIWFVRGLWTRRIGSPEAAARCFLETLRIAPEHRQANYQLGLTLHTLQHPSADAFAERASDLFSLTVQLDEVLKSDGRSVAALQQVAGLLEKTGRYQEAHAWYRIADELLPGSRWSRAGKRRVASLLDGQSERTADSLNLVLSCDLTGFPTYVTLLENDSSSGESSTASDEVQVRRPLPSTIRFADVADSGLDFVYDNGADPETPGARMFEQTGGGVGVADFDSDGWPDLYMSQGGAFDRFARDEATESNQKQPELATPNDRLFRNLHGTRFEDVSTQARLLDRGFGQGVAAGDIDNDGFPDLYVANIGRNQLLLNNGDGTFSEITDEAGLTDDAWTTSCLIADLNADGAPDLFDVNYLTGHDVFTRICNGKACSPRNFDGEPDRLIHSTGDGRFVLLEDATPRQNAKGLGILAADLSGQKRLDLFIANDQVPNHLLRNVPTEKDGGVRFVEDGFVSGLAVNQAGLAMACMGVAAEDVNADGLLDLFVTNFKDEFNTLYLQDSSGLFVDATNRSGLGAPGYPYVGWGAQFLDADLDGDFDLIVVNGHVDDYRESGEEYQMPPQLFEQTSEGRFELLSPDTAGPCFARSILGRGLARLDWDRDGRPEFVASVINGPALIQKNVSTSAGRTLSIRLVGTQGSRDAIGAIVRVSHRMKSWRRQLTAGDGYQASSQRILQFAIDSDDWPVHIAIDWPSGLRNDTTAQPSHSSISIIEGGVE
jgi:tetratricopeptide (TPR) repeat protein